MIVGPVVGQQIKITVSKPNFFNKDFFLVLRKIQIPLTPDTQYRPRTGHGTDAISLGLVYNVPGPLYNNHAEARRSDSSENDASIIMIESELSD